MKETFYIRHDYNARHDERILKLRRKYPDGSGYGIYWMIVEKLAESSEGRLKIDDIDNIAFELHLESERIADVINSYGLFEKDVSFFWSNRLLSDLTERNEKSKKAILANKVRWDRERKKIQTESKRSPFGIQGKEGRKGKEGENAHKKTKYLNFVFLTKTEHTKLQTLLGAELDDYLTRLNNYIGSKGKIYKSHYYTLLNWHRKDHPTSQLPGETFTDYQKRLYKLSNHPK